VAHFGLGVWRRSWWTIYTLGFGTCVEVVGWGGRFWSYNDTNWDPNLGGLWFINDNGFIMQSALFQPEGDCRPNACRICCLVIAPTFFSAANYVLLGK